MTVESACLECRGSCCSFKTMGISFAKLPYPGGLKKLIETEDWEQLVTQSGRVPDMEFYAYGSGYAADLLFHCNHRTEEGLCGIYEERPRMCREFTCPALEGEMGVGEMLREHNPLLIVPGRKTDVTERIQAIIREAAKE